MLVLDLKGNEFVYNGNFEDYKKDVCRLCIELVEKGIYLEKVPTMLKSVAESKNFEQLFEKLEKMDVNIFSETADCILVRKRTDYFLDKYGRKVNYYCF